MKILVAGATGAIGRPMIDYLIKDGHDVYGVTHSEERALALAARGAKSVRLNILERDSVFTSVADVHPDIVIDMLTSLPKEYTPESMQKAAEIDAKVRREGGANLLGAAEKYGAKRYIVQSSAFWYEPGQGQADEFTPFAFESTPGISQGAKLYEEIERRVLQSGKIEGVALRFGFFYGPGTWFHPDGSNAERIRKQEFPIIGKGQGVWNFVHIEDAAKAIASSIYCSPGAYNIVNNHPTTMNEWLPAFARYLRAPQPPFISEEEGLRTLGADTVYYATKLRAASNAKAKREFNFEPRTFEWML
ncbi:MAG: NAD(P)-dependent oxidoreductase [Parachlamydia sp.]|nr:NAD(P)-dependent oxidoreductase [Parachlamydia sp.]